MAGTRSTQDAEAAEAARRRRVRINIATIVAVVLLIGVIGYLVQRTQDTGPVDAPAAGASEYGLTVGTAGAPHTVVVYEDFLCPFCRRFEEASSTELASLAAAGKVYLDYRPFVLLSSAGDYSKRSANAFWVVWRSAGPEVAKRFHDLLYADQPEESGPFPDDDWLVEKAVQAGAEAAQVRPGIEDLAQADAVDAATREAADSNVAATPTVLLDGKQVTGDDVASIAESVLAAVR